MINSFLASSHSSAGAGAGAASAATAITLHFNYSSSNNNNSSSSSSNKSNININKSSNNNKSGLKIVPAIMAVAATNEHKSRNIIHSAPTTAAATTTTTTAANIFKIRQSQSKPGIVAKRLIMPFDQQKLQRERGIISNWEPVNGKFNTSASTKEPQFIQVVKFKSSSSSSNNNKQSLQSTTAAIHKSAFTEVLSKPQQQQQQQQQQQKQRTEDQENAFRQIEDVHNYAKLQRHQHQPGGSSSDEIEDEEEDDEEDDVDEEELVEEDGQQGVQVHKELRVDVEFIPAKKKTIIHNDEDSEEHVEVDVVTVTPTTPQQQQQQQQQQEQHEEEQPLSSPNPEPEMRPEHHARRPMNAFLIFCKRHRAIVKERYKSLENRAITKILGDWWAALDDKEKLCFTDLAQQNKDAFFNANPNFKWYKLPAPPLRTLATRPGNAAATAAQSTDELQQHQQHQPHLQWEPKEVAHMLRRNYFKFADETQMGELSALLSGNATQENKDYALQQALSETTQFLSVHMPNSSTANNNNNNKRALQPTDSASNSSEEEERGSPSKKLKSSRSCKGKIYQELINSGQLAAIAKKSKCRLNSGGSATQDTTSSSSSPPISPRAAMAAATAADCQLLQLEATSTSSAGAAAGAVATTGSTVRHSFEFDLEEKIKELPALSLDAYLQRKRSTKKKKKFSSNKKQRNSNSSSSNSATTTTTAGGAPAAAAASSPTMTPTAAAAAAATSPGATFTPATAVGSQKRKARKESITRRDVSAIEQEVASILPLTINGCYCINHSQLPPPRTQPAAAATVSAAATVATSGFDVTSPTSDLLILAEVAANRTELTKSN